MTLITDQKNQRASRKIYIHNHVEYDESTWLIKKIKKMDIRTPHIPQKLVRVFTNCCTSEPIVNNLKHKLYMGF